MAAKKITGRSADAAAGAATARKLAAAAKIAQAKADEAKKAAAAAKKKLVASQASDAASRRYVSTSGAIITDRFGRKTQQSTLKDKKTGINRQTQTFLDEPKGSEYRSRTGYSATNAKTRKNIMNYGPKEGSYKASFGK
jgi:hypothetical protein